MQFDHTSDRFKRLNHFASKMLDATSDDRVRFIHAEPGAGLTHWIRTRCASAGWGTNPVHAVCVSAKRFDPTGHVTLMSLIRRFASADDASASEHHRVLFIDDVDGGTADRIGEAIPTMPTCRSLIIGVRDRSVASLAESSRIRLCVGDIEELTACIHQSVRHAGAVESMFDDDAVAWMIRHAQHRMNRLVPTVLATLAWGAAADQRRLTIDQVRCALESPVCVCVSRAA